MVLLPCSRSFLLPLCLAATLAVPRPGPAADDDKEIARLIEQLGNDDVGKRQEAAKKLEALGEPALAALRRASEKHPDVDVRLRAGVVARAIEGERWGEVRHFGSGANYWLNRVAFTPDGKSCVATGGAVIVYDLESGKELRRSLERSFARNGLALSRDGRLFLTGHQDDLVVRVGEVETGKPVQAFVGHKGGVHGVALAPDGVLAVSGGEDRTLRVWEVKTGKEVRQCEDVRTRVRSAAWSADGRYVLTGHFGDGKAGRTCLWDPATGKALRDFVGHTGDVTAVAFVPGGDTVLSGSMDGTLRLWDRESGKELRRMVHKGGAYDVAVSPDGRRALSAGFGDKTVRVWNLADGKLLNAFEGHPGAVLGVAFAPDGRRALSCDSRCTLYLWRLPK
jgi:WD40 repeat protein